MPHAARAGDGPDKLLPLAQLATREHVIQAEFDHQLIALHRHSARDQSLRIDRAPIGIGHRIGKAVHGRDKRIRANLPEQAGADQILGHHAADLCRQRLGPGGFRLEGGGSKGQRFDYPVGNGNLQRPLGQDRSGQAESQQKGKKSGHRAVLF